jgi:N4-(beta-N-acetylglucosaminyl)-L-asparaginase
MKPPRWTRRDFVRTGAVAGIGAMLASTARTEEDKAPTILERSPSRPVVVSSVNGHKFKNGGPRTCVQEAFERITRGEDVLDALLAGVNILELDPLEDSVGYGGLPNAEGVVQLDASVMHGPKKRAGAVAALEGVRTPSLVARAVMEHTDHHLLVGEGAQRFARQMGFTIEPDLNTEHSRREWLKWKRKTDPEHYLDPAQRAYGTIHCNGVTARGEVAGATTTSGLAWKIPGRVGDSPIPGAGNYVDNDVGAAGSTGRGEANLFSLASFLIVEEMRRGAHPKDAALTALKRIVACTVEKRLLNARGKPNFQLKFYVLSKSGQHAGVALYGGSDVTYAVCDASGPRTPAMDFLLEGTASGA